MWKAPLEVGWVRNHRRGDKGLEFLIHWKDSPPSTDSWEGVDTFVLLQSEKWREYCKEHDIMKEVWGLPVMDGEIPRIRPDLSLEGPRAAPASDFLHHPSSGDDAEDQDV